MRQTATNEKIDPLTRIQEEIKEVVRREQEYRQLTTSVTTPAMDEIDGDGDVGDFSDFNGNANKHSLGMDSTNSISISSISATSAIHSSTTTTTTAVAVVTSLNLNHQEDNSSLASSVNSKESLDEHHHSDDSGISASSSPVNGTSAHAANNNHEELKHPTLPGIKEQRYIGPNCYNMTPEPPQQKLMTRTVSTPHLAITKQRQFTFTAAHKGVMQRFIASRGKLHLNSNYNSTSANKIMLNSKSALALSGQSPTQLNTPPNSPLNATVAINATLMSDFSVRNPASPAIIERDAEGRPIRPGYVPVELKIQRELKDLKSRESELKKIRKIRQSTPDLLDAIENENVDSDDEDSEVEHCYGPGKLRTAKSISELCDSAQSNNSISPRATPSPDFDHYKMSRGVLGGGGGGGMRPAMSLAQLCDLDPEEAPSSHRLIAQWESLIQQNA